TSGMNSARKFHTASVLSNGTVLVSGGQNNVSDYLNSAELYDPSTGVWMSTGSMNNARYRHTASILSNGTVLVSGGQNSGDYLNSAE
ncbi:unnamed protein product, partial [Adineta steineri]